MFKSARIKLTTWYLVIIMAISLSFSVVIYRGVTLEFQRRLNTIEKRFNVEARRGWRMHGPVHEIFVEDLNQARARVLFILLYANGVILVLSAAAGYFLAGRTIAPIEKALEEQKRFVADASHELKTPLTAMRTSIEVALRDKKLTLSDSKKVLTGSLEDIDGLKNLANNLLSLAKYQGGENFTFEKTSVKELINSSYKKVRLIANKKGVKINLDVKKGKISANKESLEKLVTILLDNAVKYSLFGGKVTLTTKRNKKYLKIKVVDSGVGISKADLPHIFDRFYRVDDSRTKTKVPGFGLGLSMAKKIVEMHKGSIDVKSIPGKGSTFTVKLPLS